MLGRFFKTVMAIARKIVVRSTGLLHKWVQTAKKRLQYYMVWWTALCGMDNLEHSCQILIVYE